MTFLIIINFLIFILVFYIFYIVRKKYLKEMKKEDKERQELLEEKCDKDPFYITEYLTMAFGKARLSEQDAIEYCIYFIAAPIEIRKEMVNPDKLAKYSLVSSTEKKKILEEWREQILSLKKEK